MDEATDTTDRVSASFRRSELHLDIPQGLNYAGAVTELFGAPADELPHFHFGTSGTGQDGR